MNLCLSNIILLQFIENIAKKYEYVWVLLAKKKKYRTIKLAKWSRDLNYSYSFNYLNARKILFSRVSKLYKALLSS